MFMTRPSCPRCGQRRAEPLVIPTEGLLRETLAHIARFGGLHCDECVAEVNQAWARDVLPSLVQ